MARKGQVSIQDSIETNEELENYLAAHMDQLICMEVYSEFCGHCLATAFAVRKGKLEIGHDDIAMVKACADNIDVLVRFKNKSEPVFLFILKGKLTRAMFGANGIELCRIIEEELGFMKKEVETGVSQRSKFEIQEMLPEESAKMEEDMRLKADYEEQVERLRVLTLAARKKRVNERLARCVPRLNFILFFPHCTQAHYDLYEKWDIINIQVCAKEIFQLTEENVKEAFYMSDVELNEACVHQLLLGEIMVVLFKMFDTDDRDFVPLLRYTLYEEIPVPKEDTPPEKQLPPIPAYQRYGTISKTKREVRRERYEAKMQKLREEQEEQERLEAERARLARQEAEEQERLEKQRQEEERMARIQAGLPADPVPEEVAEEEVEGEQKGLQAEEAIPEEEQVKEEEKIAEEEVFHSDVSIDGEDYIPPGGQFVPGFYAPFNDLSRANGLAFFFPKEVAQVAQIESEHLPPHVLMMFPTEKRYEVQEIMDQFPDEILNVGVFIGEEPFHAEHLAYTFKQYNKMERPKKNKDRVALMVSRRRSLPMLQLVSAAPCYISSDPAAGERDCLALFPVGYGDDYHEEEAPEELTKPPPVDSPPEEELEAPVEEKAEEEDTPVQEPQIVQES